MRSLQSLSLLVGAALALSPAQWRSQSIYQVITDRFALTNGSTTQPCGWGNYCGGTWQGLISKLDYIKGMGFTAVWISPVVENIANTQYGQPYHGYWAKDIYSLNSNFGTAADLKALSAALHSRGMYLMVDVVANHMASAVSPASVQYSQYNPFDDAKYYHSYCPLDYGNNTSVTQCWMGDTVVPLPDLKTEDSLVQQRFQTWISQLVSNYSIDGLRLDSAMQTGQSFWPGFVSASGVYAVGEVLDGNPTTLCTWQSYMPGMLNYAAYFWLIRAFSSNTATLSELANNIQWLSATCQDTTLLGNFLENQDQPRFPSITTDTGLTKNAIAFTVLTDGIPIIYQGQEQGFSGAADPYNREPLWTSSYSTKSAMYTFISSLNVARRLAINKDSTYAGSKSTVWYSDSQTIVTKKGASSSYLISLFTNRGAGNSGSITLAAAKTGISPGTRFTDLLSCDVFTADASGNVAISITNGQPRALYLSSALSGSDACAYTNTSSVTIISAARIESTKSATSTNPATLTAKPSTAPSTSASTSCGGLVNGTTYTSSGGQSFLIECGIDHSAGDITMVQVSNANGFKECIETCASTSGCVDVSLSGVACYLKKSVGTPVHNAVSGAKLITTTTSSACPVASTVAVAFFANITTQWLESVSVVGSIPELGNWSPPLGFNLSAAAYTSSSPIWSGTVKLAAGTQFQYKLVKYNSTSNALLVWEKDPNRSFTVPRSCATTAGVSGSWQF